MKVDQYYHIFYSIGLLIVCQSLNVIAEKNVNQLSLANETENGKPSFLQQTTTISRFVVVDKYGRGDYVSVQSAIDSVPDNNKKWVYIQINAGIYLEKVTIPYNKPYIILQGAGRESTIISWNARANRYGTAESATFTANAANLIAMGIGFKNGAPAPSPGDSGGQAVAVLLTGDMMAFYECGFYGAQDTLFDYQGRHYFKGCYIEGSIDFIFGHGQSTYQSCHLFVKAQPGYLSGSITAHNRDNPTDGSGFVFIECNITGSGDVYLGRAWGPYSRVVFIHSFMTSIITPEGWSDFDIPGRQRTAYYGEYKNFGPGANPARRVPWAHQLTDKEVGPFIELNHIDGQDWLWQT